MYALPPHESHGVRLRVDGDWPAMLELWVEAWRETYPEIDFEARRDWLLRHVSALEAQGSETFCLYDSTPALAGFVVINPTTGWLDQICVSPRHFGSDAGGTLLAAARNVSPGLIRLDVNADNARALRFYERDGFMRVGRGANTLSGRETIMMEWRAAAP